MLRVVKQEHPYSIDLDDYGLTDRDVQGLSIALQVMGADSDCEDTILYPTREPNNKTQQLIAAFIFGVQVANNRIDGTAVDYDVFEELFAPKKRRSRKMDAEESVLEIVEVDDTEDEEPKKGRSRRKAAA